MSDFQREAGVQGRSFEETVAFMLKAAGWQITATRLVVEGAEIDIVAVEPVTNVEWWIECKGSHRGKTPGCQRGDTVKKAVGVAAYLWTLEDARPYRLITSHLPIVGSLGDRMLRSALEQGWFRAIDAVGFLSSAFEEPRQEDEDDAR